MDPQITTLGIPTGLAGWNILQKKTPADFPALTKDPVLKREIAYFEKNAPKALTAKALLSDRRLQDFVLTAYGMTSETGMNALMQKVLESNPSDSKSFVSRMTDVRFKDIAKAFNYGGPSTPAVPATPSSAEVVVGGLFQGSNFSSFSGTFAGVSVNGVSLTGVTTWQGLASTLQNAFQRADGNRTDISVTVNGSSIKFSDTKGRGSAVHFAWTVNPQNTDAPPTASSPMNRVDGSPAVAATGGPAVTNSSFIQQVVQKYTNAQYQTVVGNTSNTLREALYAKQQLPGITNWYSVIANRPLANVIQTVLRLPSSFALLDVDKQAKALASRMNIKDFQNPAKLSTLLTRFVATSAMQTQQSATATALQLLDNSSSKNGFVTMTLPAQTATDTFSSASAAAMILSAANG